MARPSNRNRQRGVVLLLAIIALLLIAAVGAAILYMAAAESGFVGSQRAASRSFYAGMGGLEEARYRMLPGFQPTGSPPLGLNYTDPLNLIGIGGIPIFPCTASEMANTLVPCNTITVNAYPVRNWHVLYLINSAAANPAAPGNNVNLPPAFNNDPFLPAEVPGATISTTGSIQPGAGTGTSVPYQWVRIHLKTERSARQDLNLDGTMADDDPIFNYLGRQYRRSDLLLFDPTGSLLQPPWGPVPPANSGRNCVAAVCAQPVYLVTAFATTPGRVATGRVVRSEVSSLTGFSINAGILSQPDIHVIGGSQYIGYDQCDPDCPPGMPFGTPFKDDNPYPSHVGDPGLIPNCSSVIPLQSSAPSPQSDQSGTSYRTYPNTCTVTNPGASHTYGCIQEASPFPYDVAELINILRPSAVQIPSGNYQNIPSATINFGTFPPAPYPGNLVSGAGAVPQTTYINGPLKCSSGCKGAGILIVDCPTCTSVKPALTLDASMEFYGIIIVNGPVSILGGGSPPSGCNLYGAMITSGSVTTDLGGSMCYRYNSCAQRDLFRNRPFGQLSFREIPY
ncbi:MAG: hypothetical protein ACRD4D_10305 [Candidatus Acidiferrales bacterium]